MLKAIALRRPRFGIHTFPYDHIDLISHPLPQTLASMAPPLVCASDISIPLLPPPPQLPFTLRAAFPRLRAEASVDICLPSLMLVPLLSFPEGPKTGDCGPAHA